MPRRWSANSANRPVSRWRDPWPRAHFALSLPTNGDTGAETKNTSKRGILACLSAEFGRTARQFRDPPRCRFVFDTAESTSHAASKESCASEAERPELWEALGTMLHPHRQVCPGLVDAHAQGDFDAAEVGGRASPQLPLFSPVIERGADEVVGPCSPRCSGRVCEQPGCPWPPRALWWMRVHILDQLRRRASRLREEAEVQARNGAAACSTSSSPIVGGEADAGPEVIEDGALDGMEARHALRGFVLQRLNKSARDLVQRG